MVITKLELGGAQRHVLTIARELPKDTYEVTLISSSEGELLDESRKISSVRIITVPNLVRELSPFNDLKAYLELERLFKLENFDVVHTHSSKAGILGRWAARSARVTNIIHTVHGFPFHPFQPAWLRRLYIALERSAARACQALIVVTPADQEKGLNAGVGRLDQYVTIRAGIDFSQLTPVPVTQKHHLKTSLGIPSDHFVIGTMAVLKPQKAPLDFVRMVHKFVQLNTDIPITFIYVGVGEMEQSFLKAIQQFGLEGKIKWLGRWSKPLNEFYGLLDLFVLTSLWEGLPGVIIEAQTMGVPILATGVDGSREFIRDGQTGWITPPAEPALMAEKILKIIHNAPARTTISHQAKASLAQEFEQSVMVSRIHQLYQQLSKG